jgi:hypothetical protein
MATLPLPAGAGTVATMPRSVRIALGASAILVVLGALRWILGLADIDVPSRLRLFISPVSLVAPVLVLLSVFRRREHVRAMAFGLSLLVSILLGVALVVIPFIAAITGMHPGGVPTGAFLLVLALHAAVAWGLSRRDAKAWFAAPKA